MPELVAGLAVDSRASLSIGFYGLGTMGFAMATRLARIGFPVAVRDAIAARAEEWREQADRGDHDAASSRIVVSCVTDHQAIESLLLGPAGLIGTARPGQLFIDHTTTSPGFAVEAAKAAAEQGALWVDAPLSGGAAGAASGTLSAFVGGTAEAVLAARPVLAAYSARITHLGGPGSGQAGKLANQIAIAGTLRGLAEARDYACTQGLDLESLLSALGAGSAQSSQLEQHRAKLASDEFQFAREFAWIEKDLELVLSQGSDSLPVTALVAALLASR